MNEIKQLHDKAQEIEQIKKVIQSKINALPDNPVINRLSYNCFIIK